VSLIRNQTFSGLFWTFSQQFSSQLIIFINSIFLARLLLPSEFGLIAMVTVFVAIGNSLVIGGMSSSLIRTPNANDEDYSTVFYVNLAVSLVLYFIIYFCAPFIADFYKQSMLVAIIRIYTLTFIITAFVAVQTTRLTKEMQFKIQMKMQIPSLIVGGISGIILAYLGYGVWSLVWMNLIQKFLFTIQHWFYSDWKPSLTFSIPKFKEHFNFGSNLTLESIINSLFDNAYSIIIGKFFAVNILGYYNRANTLQSLPAANIGQALDKVTYPLFSKMQTDDERLKIGYKKILQQVIFWILPLMVFSAILAYPIFRFLFTEKWVPAVPYFQILTVAGILYPLQTYNLNILRVKGRSDLTLRINIIKKITFIIFVAIAVRFGIIVLLYFQVLYAVVAYFYNSYYSGKFINYPAMEQLKDILPIVVLGLIAGFILLILDVYLFKYLDDLIRIILGFLTGYLTFGLLSGKLKLAPFIEARLILNGYIENLKRSNFKPVIRKIEK
jgi:teichuronic acid exporter